MEVIMTYESRRLAGILLIVLPTFPSRRRPDLHAEPVAPGPVARRSCARRRLGSSWRSSRSAMWMRRDTASSISTAFMSVAFAYHFSWALGQKPSFTYSAIISAKSLKMGRANAPGAFKRARHARRSLAFSRILHSPITSDNDNYRSL
jgi:hypothetical protein